jgi:hypothetical protein
MTLAQVTDVAKRSKASAISAFSSRYRTLLDLMIVTAVALALRLSAVDFGLPIMLHPDEPSNIAVGATMAANGSWDPHYFAYPSLLYDVEAITDLVARLFTGHMITPTSFATEGMGINRTVDQHIVLFLRLITVALSVGICLIMYAVIRRITGRRWLAVGCGLVGAVSPLLITNGVFITPDTYSAFFTAATLACALVVLRRGKRLDYILAGVAVGFTAGSKYDIVSATPLVVAYLLREGRNALQPRTLLHLVTAGVAAAAAFALTTPATLFDTGSMITGLKGELTHYATGHPGAQGGTLHYYLSTLMRDQAVLLPGAVLAVVAACYGRFRKEVIVVGTFAICFFILIASQTVRFDRDLIPLLPALILLTGFAAAWIAELVASRWRGMPGLGRPALAGVAAIGVLVPALVSALGVPQTLDDAPKTEALAWLEAHVPKGAPIVNENYGPWIDAGLFQVTHVSYVVSVQLPSDPQAIIVTEEGSGRFIGDSKVYPNENNAYKALLTDYCVSAKFADGPWVEVLTPCH